MSSSIIWCRRAAVAVVFSESIIKPNNLVTTVLLMLNVCSATIVSRSSPNERGNVYHGFVAYVPVYTVRLMFLCVSMSYVPVWNAVIVSPLIV